ncbi:MAG: hypothetical protein EOP06_21855 [Proteobacteria bacterium]|nr:MAG: hypothetical protein EOP06_21855 [Pseudomonadota bacterium]
MKSKNASENMQLLAKLFVAPLILFVGAFAFADAKGANSAQFKARIAAFEKSCTLDCRKTFSQSLGFAAQEQSVAELSEQLSSHLKAVSDEQVQVWGDTILEGDYISEGETHLDRVIAITENGALIGYRITYSAPAWYIGECSFSPRNPESLKACQDGRIEESSYVSPDMQSYFRDESDFADFVEVSK